MRRLTSGTLCCPAQAQQLRVSNTLTPRPVKRVPLGQKMALPAVYRARGLGGGDGLVGGGGRTGGDGGRGGGGLGEGGSGDGGFGGGERWALLYTGGGRDTSRMESR